jgi:hypothetical protein
MHLLPMEIPGAHLVPLWPIPMVRIMSSLGVYLAPQIRMDRSIWNG